MAIYNDTAAALYTALTGGTALTALLAGTTSVYNMQAPDGASLDYVVFQFQGGGPENVNPSSLENNLWTVRCHSETSAKQAGLIFEQVDTLLHRKSLTVGGAAAIWCARETNLSSVETTPDGEHIYMVGGIYRIRTTGV